MINEIDLNWNNNLSFVANVDGHKLILDSSDEAGGENKGPRPKSLMLVALGGCTGMDVISILKKMHVDIKSLNVKVIGHARDEHPKKYIDMKIIYKCFGNNLEKDKIEKAVNLSLDKYCSVMAAYKETIKIEHEIEINQIEIN